MVRIHEFSIESSQGMRMILMEVNVLAISEELAKQRAKAKIRRRFPGTLTRIELGTVEARNEGAITSFFIEVAIPSDAIRTEAGLSEIVESFAEMF